MKQEYKQKLLVAYDTINHNLRDLNYPQPTLFFNHKAFKEHVKRHMGMTYMTRYYSIKEKPTGICDAGAIYVNPEANFCWYITRGYSDYLYVLIHKLTHYYYPQLEHGFKFEQRIGKLFKMIPEDKIYTDLPPWPRVVNEMMYLPCPECMCLVRVHWEDGAYVFVDSVTECDYCSDPYNLKQPHPQKENSSDDLSSHHWT
jgi:hypothetical protein